MSGQGKYDPSRNFYLLLFQVLPKPSLPCGLARPNRESDEDSDPFPPLSFKRKEKVTSERSFIRRVVHRKSLVCVIFNDPKTLNGPDTYVYTISITSRNIKS